MTYLQHKDLGNVEWTQSVETDIAAWLTPGKYLRNSTLRPLAKKFTGEDLPEEMLEEAEKLTFFDDDELLPSLDSEKGTRLEKAVLDMRAIALAPRTPDGDDSEEDIEDCD